MRREWALGSPRRGSPQREHELSTEGSIPRGLPPGPRLPGAVQTLAVDVPAHRVHGALPRALRPDLHASPGPGAERVMVADPAAGEAGAHREPRRLPGRRHQRDLPPRRRVQLDPAPGRRRSTCTSGGSCCRCSERHTRALVRRAGRGRSPRKRIADLGSRTEAPAPRRRWRRSRSTSIMRVVFGEHAERLAWRSSAR